MVEDAVFPLMSIFGIFVKDQVALAVQNYIWAHWSMSLFLYQYHAIFSLQWLCSIALNSYGNFSWGIFFLLKS